MKIDYLNFEIQSINIFLFKKQKQIYPLDINLSFDNVRRTFLADSLGVSPTPPYSNS